MDGIVDVEGDRAKQLALIFMGQHVMGGLKDLEKNIISKNNTMQGMTLDPNKVLNSIPGSPRPPAPQPIQPQIIHQPSFQQVPVKEAAVQMPAPVPAAPVVVPTLVPATKPLGDQLEFNFDESPLSQRIFEKIETLNKRVSNIEKTLEQILAVLNKTKTSKKTTW